MAMSEENVLLRASTATTGYRVRTIAVKDLFGALRDGLDDFNAHPTHGIFLTLLYPVIGLLLVWVATNENLLPLAFPLVSGFALVGPFLALGLYEISRCYERGEEIPRWWRAFNIFRYPAFGAIATLGVALAAIFFAWLAAALYIYEITFAGPPPPTIFAFLHETLTTRRGWQMIVLGNGIGFLFALSVLAIAVVSFPLIIDRRAGVGAAILTSVDVVVRNPLPMALWGIIVAVGLAIAALPFLVGLIFVFPILGHATWHLYRRVVY